MDAQMVESTHDDFSSIHITYVDKQVRGPLKERYSESINKLKNKNIINNDQWNYFGSIFMKSDNAEEFVFVVVLPRIFDPEAYPENKRHRHAGDFEAQSRFMLTEQTGLIMQMWKLIRYYKETENDRDSWKQQDDIVSFPSLDDTVENPSIDAILSAFHLWYDYQEKKRLVFTERHLSPQGKGRIGWQKSIFRGEPIHTENGEVYRDLYRTVVRVDPYHEFVNFHTYICQWIGQHLFGEQLEDSLDKEIPLPPDAFDLLEKYEDQLYQDRHLEVYQHLRVWCEFLSGSYTTGLSDPDSMNGVFVQFRFLWEWLLQKTMQQKPEKGTGVPNLHGQYYLLNDQTHKGMEPRLDLIVDLKDSESLLILDAKDYRAHLKRQSKLPHSGDIYKQIVYRLAWKKWADDNKRNIYNAFLFPYDLSNYQSSVLYYGAHVPKNDDKSHQTEASDTASTTETNDSSTKQGSKRFEETDFAFTVHCFLVDFLSLVDCVLEGGKDMSKVDTMLTYMNKVDGVLDGSEHSTELEGYESPQLKILMNQLKS